MKTNRGNITIYFVNSLFLAGIIISLFLQQTFILIFWALPFVLFDRSYLIPLLLLMPLIEGALLLEASMPPETTMIVTYSPILLYDIFKKKHVKIPAKYKQVFYLFFIMIMFGTIVALLSTVKIIPAKDILIANGKLLLKLTFLLLFLLFLVGHGTSFILKGLRHLTFIMPIFLIALFIYMKYFGKIEGFHEMLNFGTSKHGEFTATLVSLAVYTLWHFFKKNVTIYYRIFILFTLIITLWVILMSGSRNGLLSFGIMIITAIYFFIGFNVRVRNIMIVFLLLIPVIYFIINNIESVAIQRLTSVVITDRGIEGQGVQRIDLWKGAILGFFDKPLTGQGASYEITRAIEIKYAQIDNVVHNTFFELALQFGIFGIFVYVFLQLQIYKGTRLINMERLRSEPEASKLMLPFVSYISLFFSSMFVSWVWTSIIWYNICLIFAIVILTASKNHVRKPLTS